LGVLVYNITKGRFLTEEIIMLQIEDNRGIPQTVPFLALQTGEWFEYENAVHVKISDCAAVDFKKFNKDVIWIVLDKDTRVVHLPNVCLVIS